MKRKIFIVSAVVSMCLCLSVSSSAAISTWTIQEDGGFRDSDSARGIAIDPIDKSVYVTGTKNLWWGVNSIWIAKYDQTTEIEGGYPVRVWEQDLSVIISAPGGRGVDIAVTKGFVYVVGIYYDEVLDVIHTFVVKLNSGDGSIVWHSIIEKSWGRGIAVGIKDQIYIVGHKQRQSPFHFPPHHYPVDDFDTFFARYNPPSREPVWFTEYNSQFISPPYQLNDSGYDASIAIDPRDSKEYLYLTGRVTIPDIHSPSGISSAPWAARVSPGTGDIMWDKYYTDGASEAGNSITITNTGDICILTDTTNRIYLDTLGRFVSEDGPFITSYGGISIVTLPGGGVACAGGAMYTLDSILHTSAWNIHIPNLVGGADLAVDSEGAIYVAGGIYTGSLIPSPGETDIFIRKYAPDGTTTP